VSIVRVAALAAGTIIIAVAVAALFPTGTYLWFVAPSACASVLGGGLGLTIGRKPAVNCAVVAAVLTVTLRWMGYEASQPFPIS
jgi:hypothetical protein